MDLAANLLWRLRLNFYLVLPSEVALPHGSPMPAFIVEAVPMFFLMMAVEAVVAAYRQPPNLRYNLSDFLCSWALGALQQVFELLCDLASMKFVLASYSAVYDHCRLLDLDVATHPWLTFFGLLFGLDFLYYWFHRVVHEYHTLWALGHSVHHTGEYYNMGASLRQGMLQSVTSWPFFLLLALVFPPAAFLAHFQLNALYQIWPHTELVGRAGLLEYMLSTPSSHRMHHRPPGNCNYGGVFIIWDKMFGTFQPERTRQDWYGLAAQPQTFNLVTINSLHFRKMHCDLKGGILRNLFARRVPFSWTFDPLAVFRPLPPLVGRAPDTTKRAKYAGPSCLSRPMRILTGVGAIALTYTTILTSVERLCQPHQTVLLALASVGLLCGASEVIDGRCRGWATALGLASLVAALAALGRPYLAVPVGAAAAAER